MRNREVGENLAGGEEDEKLKKRLAEIDKDLGSLSLGDLLRGDLEAPEQDADKPEPKASAPEAPVRKFRLEAGRRIIIELLEQNVIFPDMKASEIPAYLEDKIKEMEKRQQKEQGE